MFATNGHNGHSNGTNSFTNHSSTPTPPPTAFGLGDGSWELRIRVTDLNMDRVLRVKSSLHIGGVMLSLVEELDIATDWSDHALWWPKKNVWLTHTRSTLDQCGVTASAELEFTPMHKMLRVQMPDLREMDFNVDFSVKTFNAVVSLCKHIGLRYPEEISFCKPITGEDLKVNHAARQMKKVQAAKTLNEVGPADTNSFVVNKSHNTSNGSLERSANNTPGTPSTPGTPWRKNTSLNGTYNSSNGFNGSSTFDSTGEMEQLNASLTNSPARAPEDARNKLPKPKTLLEKARSNVGWLDSSLSVMEQGIRDGDTLLLRFKFFSFYDLNPKYDGARINLIYSQAKYGILNEEIDCTEEEMLMFAALQLQVNLQMSQPQLEAQSTADEDIERALNELQFTLEGDCNTLTPNMPSNSDIMHVPELKGYLKFMKPRRFTLRTFKQYYFVCKDMRLFYYRNNEEEEVLESIDLRGCEATPDVILSSQRYGIRLEVPSSQGMTEYMIRCNDEDQYARWMAAMRLASKGKSLADSSYQSEVRGIQAFLSLQQPARTPALSPQQIDIQVEDFLAPRFSRRMRGGKGVTRILEAHANVKELSLSEAKMQFIRAWQALPEYGLTLFLVKHMGHKKEELLGVAFNRIMKMDLNTGDHLKTWRYNNIKAWNVNWGTRHMMIQTDSESLTFSCLTADCKVVHEYIGGYIFLSMRTKDANQTLNDELFHKLTGGWI